MDVCSMPSACSSATTARALSRGGVHHAEDAEEAVARPDNHDRSTFALQPAHGVGYALRQRPVPREQARLADRHLGAGHRRANSVADHSLYARSVHRRETRTSRTHATRSVHLS